MSSPLTPSLSSPLTLSLSLSPLLLLLTTALSLSLLTHHLLTRARRARWARQHNLQPATNVVKTRERLVGADFIVETMRASREARYLALLCDRHARYGHTYVAHRWLYQTISTRDPENLKHILAVAFNDFVLPDTRKRAMQPLFGHGIFNTDGHTWAHSRQLLRPAMKKNNLAPVMRMMERHFQIMLESIRVQQQQQQQQQQKEVEAKAKDKSDDTAEAPAIDLQPLLFAFTMDTATEFLLGRSTHTLDPARSSAREAAFVRDYVACCVEAVRRMRLSPLRPLWTDRRVAAARARAWRYIDGFVDDAVRVRGGELPPAGDGDEEKEEEEEEEGNEDISVEYNFLREVALDNGDRPFLRDQILNVLLAGRDTTAGLMSALLFTLARRPDVYDTLRAEVAAHFGDEPPTQETLRKATYLDWCLKEALRLYPTVPINGRQAVRDTWLPAGGGPDGRDRLFVAKGTTVLYSVWALHRREDVFGADAEVFRPERWDGLRPGWAFLPFNGGPRICLGQQFALTEAAYVMVRMIQSFSAIEARDDRPWIEKHTLAICSKNGVWCALTPSS